VRSDIDCRVVYTIARRATREIRAQISTLGGKHFADLRLFVVSQETGELIPTRKGVTVPVSDLSELRRAVEALTEAAEAMGAEPGRPAMELSDAAR
jgi:Transcriptional Coactivator p15 (PC4)